MPHSPIDIVVPWVDGNDPLWQAERSQYRPAGNADGSAARFREWGQFQYWFRSIEKYAPWVRTVHLITWGHLPPWLNVNHPKLHVVNHKDYIPAEYLPTFSSHTLELNMHRIEGLADHFIYFNDDVYLNAPTKPEDFFKDGLPVDSAVLNPVHIADNFSFMPYIYLNILGCLNMTFSKRKVIKQNPSKWFNLKYGKYLLLNISCLSGRHVPGFKNFHTCIPFCKQTLQEVWEAFPAELERTCKNRFRSREDVNQYFFRYWRLMQGQFTPGKPNSRYYTVGEDSAETVIAALQSQKHKVVCINDDPSDCDLEAEQAKISAALQAKFPTQCSWEK